MQANYFSQGHHTNHHPGRTATARSLRSLLHSPKEAKAARRGAPPGTTKAIGAVSDRPIRVNDRKLLPVRHAEDGQGRVAQRKDAPVRVQRSAVRKRRLEQRPLRRPRGRGAGGGRATSNFGKGQGLAGLRASAVQRSTEPVLHSDSVPAHALGLLDHTR